MAHRGQVFLGSDTGLDLLRRQRLGDDLLRGQGRLLEGAVLFGKLTPSCNLSARWRKIFHKDEGAPPYVGPASRYRSMREIEIRSPRSASPRPDPPSRRIHFDAFILDVGAAGAPTGPAATRAFESLHLASPATLETASDHVLTAIRTGETRVVKIPEGLVVDGALTEFRPRETFPVTRELQERAA